MKITNNEINDTALSSYGLKAVHLINEQNYNKLAELFGYALSYGEKPASMIEKEIVSCLSQAGSDAKLQTSDNTDIVVKYFDKNNINLIAVVECLIPIKNGVGEVLIELIVAGENNDNHISLEQISYAA